MSDETHRDDLAPYLLGALAEPDAAALERHLDGCPHCRAALDQLRPAAGALAEAVPQVDPPARLKASLMAVVEREWSPAEARTADPARDETGPVPASGEPSRPEDARPAPAPRERSRLRGDRPPWHRRWWPRSVGGPRLAFGAALLLVIGAVAGYAVRGGSDEGGRVVTAQVDRARIPSGTASLRVDDGVLRLRDFPAAGRGRAYQVWLRRDGRVSSQGVFVVDAGGQGAAALTRRLSDRDEVLVTREPAGGSPAPTEQPILSVGV